MKPYYLFYITLAIGISTILMPESAMAFSIFNFDSPSTDKSMYYLGMIFGPVGATLPSEFGNPVISSIFTVFNYTVLALGCIVVSYTIVLSTLNTAQEGEVMGKKWSSTWIPIRSAMGVAFLLPTASGYSALQIIMMAIVVYGIGAANQLWSVVVNAFSGAGTGFSGKIIADNVATAAQNTLTNTTCQYVLNSNPACRSVLGANNYVAFYQDPNNSSLFYWGVQGNPAFRSICGSATSAAKPAQVTSQLAWDASNYLALELAINSYGLAVGEMVAGSLPSVIDVLPNGRNAIQGALAAAPQTASSSECTTGNLGSPACSLQQALLNGWIFAGSYYYVMITNGNNTYHYTSPNVTSPSALNGLGSCASAYSNALGNQTAYLSKSEVSATYGLTTTSLNLPQATNQSGISGIMDAIAGPLRNGIIDFMKTFTTNDARGPVPSMAGIGMNILNVAENIWFGVMLAGFIALIFGCLFSGQNPMCWALAIVLAVAVPVLTIIIGLLWGVGAMLAIYLPMIPYIVFTFTAFGWMLLVIETIVAAPVVALGLVSPAGDHLGQASHAVLLVVNVFLRPSLMIIGFVVGAKLVDAVVTMLNYGFFATVNASISGLGIFGTIALLTLYGGTAIALVQECFSLIYVLPDKIIRWLGGHAEHSQVKQQLKDAKGNVDAGAQAGSGLMKGSAGLVDSKFGSGGKGMKELKGKMGGKK